MIVIKEHIVPVGVSEIRLIDYALSIFPDIPTRSAMKKAIKRGEILVNNVHEKSGKWISAGQSIKLIDLELAAPKPLDFPLEVVFEDDHIAIINKPSGIEISGNKYFTIQNALITNLSNSSQPDALKWARPVHRLDRPTTGLLLIAKTASSLANLGQQFENNQVHKKYRALVAGRIDNSGELSTPVGGKESYTRYSCIDRCRSSKTDWISEVDLFPETGRRHQLRIQLADYGYPIVGEKEYGDGPVLKGKGLFLTSLELCFTHPNTAAEVKYVIEAPSKFESFMKKEQSNWEKQQKLD